MDEILRLRIDRLGRRGEGVADRDGAVVYLPYALPGEIVSAAVAGDRGQLVETLVARPDRVAPVCPYYGRCGGCAVQTLPTAAYAAWKRDLAVSALERARVAAVVAPLVDAHGAGRRRATFHVRFPSAAGRSPEVGFMEARAHTVVDLGFCPILDPAMADALPAARALAVGLRDHLRKPFDALVTATDSGLDVDLRGAGPLAPDARGALLAAAARLDLARVANHGDVLLARRAPGLSVGAARVALPPGAFLQATRRGEEVLGSLVRDAVARSGRVADLFCGIGTFALRLAASADVCAWDADEAAITALHRAARATPALRPVAAATRDLFGRPLIEAELDAFDAVVFDPPRAGAAAQARRLARSRVPTVVAVSCDPGTFARDAATLVGGGYAVERVTPVDQFRYSPHIEIVAVFRRSKAGAKRRRLLS